MVLLDKIFNAGVVGAGGAGFPSHIKANSKVEFVLANGAECEPLIHKDYELMLHFPKEITKGLELLIESTSAKKGLFGIKEKNVKAISTISKYLNGKTELTKLGDFYPSGDEFELVYEATGKLIPPAGIPLDIGCVVNNVETLYNIAQAGKEIPVTKKIICVAGAVKKPSSFFVPIGTSFKDIIEFAGGTIVKDFGIFVGGVMMGSLTFNLNDVVTKTTAGLILLPKDHYLIKRKNQPEQSWHRIGKSACDQCSYCTEFCPRYLLGYQVEPHKVMRSLGFTKTGSAVWNQMAELCCACGLCTLYACPEDLYPKEACDKAKTEMREAGIKFVQQKPVKVHPIKEGRRVPLKQLIMKLKLQDYDVEAPFNSEKIKVNKVKIPLQQHIGKPAEALVKKGEVVEEGQMIGEVPDGELGANIHASIKGKVKEATKEFILIES
ncbi:MAG: 4Fe-4S dicluster domain-containing protein [Ignavibacteriaceae bacterium]|jgi:Na+-translocating ferredoxin:NAD+ oxidoreductase RnfC subunit|nr:4Fe-4S dicluster domain-containing protein [Ignavibacteriaceae bacterium]MCW8824728.1 4Fe-4S dicluster domain-containing protein [Ignavibacteriaceae bacterium]MCW8959998.1 4Fe-4S dicluster domain-containing protein [Ignavibacteriaceae bacterium]